MSGATLQVPAPRSPATVSPAVDVSLVLPLFNEQDNVEPLYREVATAMDGLGVTYEVVAVDDGSRDRTYEELRAVHARDPHWRVVRLRRNFGQTAAFSAGFAAARGAYVVTMDADLQNDPADVQRLLAKLDEGFDVVSGWRTKRKEPLLSRRLPSRIANRLISWATGVPLHDYGCSLKAYRREVLENLRLYGELHRFLPAIASWQGIRIAELPVNDRRRQAGDSKYGLLRVFKVLLDILLVRFLLGYATRPFVLFGGLGGLLSAAGFVLFTYLAYVKLGLGQAIGNRPLLILATVLVVIGIQIVCTGLLSEVAMRTYFEAVGQTPYLVRDVLENDGSPTED